MADTSAVVNAAKRLQDRDETALLIQVGLRQKAVELNPTLKDQAELETKYDENTMGALDDIKALGNRVLKRWNKELYGLVCSNSGADEKERQAVLNSLNLGQAAVIAAVAGALMGIGVPAPVAAPLAPLITKKFIWPAKDELCGAWGEAIKAQS